MAIGILTVILTAILFPLSVLAGPFETFFPNLFDVFTSDWTGMIQAIIDFLGLG